MDSSHSNGGRGIVERQRRIMGQFLGREVARGALSAYETVSRRIGTDIIGRIERSGLGRAATRLIIPARTLEHRRQHRQRLSAIESERAWRIIHILSLAIAVLGSREMASAWLGRPRRAFGEKSPLSLLENEAGGRAVEEALIRIDEGYAA